MNIFTTAALLSLAVMAGSAQAHNDKHHPARTDAPVVHEQKDWGIAGDVRQARRTIEFRMGDDMRFTPGALTVRQGETVRLRVRNEGRQMHEYVIGTPAENAKHAELMVKFPDMAHDEPYMAHVPPGQTRDIVWTFNRAGSFEFACLIAGHYQAGMKGSITVEN
jgi:uncharacterized cupredoxin-like copper-binding protein